VAKLVDIVLRVHVAEPVQRYAVSLTTATRRSPELLLGASPRATLHLVRAAKAVAAMDGRDFVVPDDVRALAVPVLTHRLIPTVEAAMGGRTVLHTLESIVTSVPMPGAAQGPASSRQAAGVSRR
jgi:MoxR-like ATPase